MRLKWYGHACFRLECADLAIVTDPYTPATSGLKPVQDEADIVIRSSSDDDFHCNASMIRGQPTVLDAMEIASAGPLALNGLRVEAWLAMESLVHKANPKQNAMYRLELDGLGILHLGDLGNAFSHEQIAGLRGRVDIMLALTGGAPTIALPDLAIAIRSIRPKVVVPMHYRIPSLAPSLREKLLPVDAFTSLYPSEVVVTVGGSEMELHSADMPEELRIYVLDPAA